MKLQITSLNTDDDDNDDDDDYDDDDYDDTRVQTFSINLETTSKF